MVAVSRQGLALTSAEFWDLTPREFFALLDFHNEQERLLNYRAGIGPSTYFNLKRDPAKQDPIHALDFFEERHDSEIRIATAEELEAKIDFVMARAERQFRERGQWPVA